MEDLVARIAAIANVILVSIAAYYELSCYKKFRKQFKWSWRKLMYGILFVYFGIVYTILSIKELSPLEFETFTHTLLRPAYTVLFALLCIGAILRKKECK